jgi:NAD(P)-dependent dehydrogenase (short-subunit alcohol dehydrogenase family)
VTGPRPVAMVTGASRGIGRAVARELATRGFRVVATMRDPDDGRGLVEDVAAADGDLTVERMDVTDAASISIPAHLELLVNNAGMQDGYLPVEHVPLDVLRALFETNVFGQIEVLQRAIPVLRARGRGVVCQITSSAILTPAPFFSAYRGSKAAMSAICDSLRAEVAPFGIRVIEILPGPVETDGLANSDTIPAVEHEPYRAMAEQSLARRPRVHEMAVRPEDAATRIVDAILDGSDRQRYGCDPMSDALLEGST